MQVDWKLNWGPLRVHECSQKPRGASLLVTSTIGVEGTTRDRFLHEVGHLKDDYEGWLLHRDSFTSEFQGITYNKTASMLGISLKTRILRGIEVPVEESAWNQVSGSIRNEKNKTAAVDTYRHGRNSYLLTMAGFGSLIGAVYVGTKSVVEIIVGKVVGPS